MVINLKTRAILGYILHQDTIGEDDIIELYQKLLDCYKNSNPIIIHSDTEPAFISRKVENFLNNQKPKIEISTTLGIKNQNQVSESINERIKTLVTKILLSKDTKGLREWRKGIPEKIKHLSLNRKSRNVELRKLLFESEFFKQTKVKAIMSAISQYNQTDYTPGISRQQAEYYNSKLFPKDTKNFQLMKSTDLMALKVQKENTESFKKVERKIAQIIEPYKGLEGVDPTLIEGLIKCIAQLVVEEHNESKALMQQGFTGLAIQNAQLLEQNEDLKKQLAEMQEQFNIIFQELMERKRKEQLIEQEKEKRKNRKRLPQRQPITSEIYNFMIQKSKQLSYSNSYRGARLRLALALLAVTGIRISELLPLKMKQVEALFVDHWIAIDRSKRGPSSHKAFLTREGSRIMKDRMRDLEFMRYFKDDNSYIFTAENSNKPLEREPFTNLINQFIKECAQTLDGKPTLTSHSFRIGFISQLWRDTNDIEFVRQAIGHAKIDTTSLYVEDMSEEEIRERMKSISSPKDLVIDSKTEFFE